MTSTFKLNPDENQVISLLVPIAYVSGAPSVQWRFLLTARDSRVRKGIHLFHDLQADDLQLGPSRDSFTVLFGDKVLAILTPTPDHGMVAGAHMVKVHFQQSPLPPTETLAAIGHHPLGSMSRIAAPKSLSFKRLLHVGEERVTGLGEQALQRMRSRLN